MQEEGESHRQPEHYQLLRAQSLLAMYEGEHQ
jgi:hypothetical protein